jgi:hypothetical protein
MTDVVHCPRCAQMLPPRAAFCLRCGLPVASQTPSKWRGPRPRPAGRRKYGPEISAEKRLVIAVVLVAAVLWGAHRSEQTKYDKAESEWRAQLPPPPSAVPDSLSGNTGAVDESRDGTAPPR